jgi:hypothetical protein
MDSTNGQRSDAIDRVLAITTSIFWARRDPAKAFRFAPTPFGAYGLDRLAVEPGKSRLRDGQQERKSSENGGHEARILADTRHHGGDRQAAPQRRAHPILEVSRCRELLGDEALRLSDPEIEELSRHGDALAHVLIELFSEHRVQKR